MDKTIAGLLGALGVLAASAVGNTAVAAPVIAPVNGVEQTAATFDPALVQDVQYRDFHHRRFYHHRYYRHHHRHGPIIRIVP